MSFSKLVLATELENEHSTTSIVSGSRRISLIRNGIRAMLVIMTVGVALIAPYFGSVMGAVGGLTDALQCFVLPPIIYFCAVKGNVTFERKFFYVLTVLWGLFLMTYTCVNTLQLLLKT
jgi:amino acid permease